MFTKASDIQRNENLKLKKEGKLEQSDEEKAYDLYDRAMEVYSNSESRRLLKQAIKFKPNFSSRRIFANPCIFIFIIKHG